LSEKSECAENICGQMRAGQVYVVSFVCTDGVAVAVDYHGDLPLKLAAQSMKLAYESMTEAIEQHENTAKRAGELIAALDEAKETGADRSPIIREHVTRAIREVAGAADAEVVEDGDKLTVKTKSGRTLVFTLGDDLESINDVLRRSRVELEEALSNA
jgi:hypothetical protein